MQSESKLIKAVESLAKSLAANGDKSNVAFVLYESVGIADKRVNLPDTVHVLLGKRTDLPNSPVGNCAFVGPLDTEHLPDYVTYLGKSTFDHAKLIFGNKH